MQAYPSVYEPELQQSRSVARWQGLVVLDLPPAIRQADRGSHLCWQIPAVIWFRRAAEARGAAAARVAGPRKFDPRRTPADVELRPPGSAPAYRYQLHRLPTAS